jgi:hypothetical protein
VNYIDVLLGKGIFERMLPIAVFRIKMSRLRRWDDGAIFSVNLEGLKPWSHKVRLQQTLQQGCELFVTVFRSVALSYVDRHLGFFSKGMRR